MAIQVQLRRGTAAQNNAFTGAIGELSFDTTANQVRIHDGSTAGGFKIGVGDFPTGTNNVALGNTALDDLDGSSPGGNNTAVGHDALTANTTASFNTAIGVSAGSLITTGQKNTILGSFDGNEGGLDIRTSNNHIVLSDGDGNPRLIIDDSGNVDIGSETTELKLKNTTHEDTDGGRESKITFQGEQSGGEQSVLAQIQASHDGTSDDQKGDLIIRTNDGSDGTSPTERLRIDSDGRTIIGHSDGADGSVSANFKLQLLGTDYTSSSFGLARFENGVNAPAIALHKSRGTSIGGDTVVQNNDELGRLRFYGNDGTDFAEGARITAEVNGTAGSNDMPTDLVFSTTADGAGTVTERMRILESGGITFNGDTAAANALDDYEEGTFTPTWSGYPTGFVSTEGRYTKIGNTVTVHVQLVTGTSSDFSGVGLDNLPFTAANFSGVGSGMAWCNNVTFYDFKTATNVIENTTTCALNMVNGGSFTSMEYVGRTPQLGASGTFRWTIIYQAA